MGNSRQNETYPHFICLWFFTRLIFLYNSSFSIERCENVGSSSRLLIKKVFSEYLSDYMRNKTENFNAMKTDNPFRSKILFAGLNRYFRVIPITWKLLTFLRENSALLLLVHKQFLISEIWLHFSLTWAIKQSKEKKKSIQFTHTHTNKLKKNVSTTREQKRKKHI
jgi:hypothetical protein